MDLNILFQDILFDPNSMNERKADNLGLNSQSVHIDQDRHEDSDCAGTEHLSPPRPATIPVARVAATPPGRPATHRPQPPPLCPASQPHVARSPRPPRPESPERPPGPALLKVIGCSSLRGGGGELGTNKNFDLWLQLVCTKLKLKYAI